MGDGSSASWVTTAASSRRSTSRRRKPAARPSSTNAGMVDNSARRQRPIARVFRGGVKDTTPCRARAVWRSPARTGWGSGIHRGPVGGRRRHCRPRRGPRSPGRRRPAGHRRDRLRLPQVEVRHMLLMTSVSATQRRPRTGRRISRGIRWNSPLAQIRRVPLLRTAPEMGLMDAEGS